MTRKTNAAWIVAGLLALAPVAARAQDAPIPVNQAVVDQAAGLIVRIGDQFHGMMRDMGLDLPASPIALTTEQVAAAFPRPETEADREGHIEIEVGFDARDLSFGDPPETPQDYAVFDSVEDCRPNTGQVVYFRTLAVDDVVGHQCVVVVEDGQGVWGMRARSVAARGDLRLISTYYLAVIIDGRPDRARALGEGAVDGTVAVSTTLADYTAAAAVVSDYRPTDDPVELARRMGRVLERLTVFATEEASRSGGVTEAATPPRS